MLGMPTIWTPAAGSTSGAAPGGVPSQTTFNKAIKHIVIVMMENHAYDNYFATYCQSRGTYCSEKADGVPPGTCVTMNPAKPKAGCVTPFPLTRKNWTINEPLPHSQTSSLAAYNNGSMNGFYLAEHSSVYPFGYYTGTTAPILWDLAEEYGMGDQFFSATLSYSLPNHWHLVAGDSPAAVQGATFKASQYNKAANRTLYLNEANATLSIEDLLAHTNVSWKWYDHPLANNYSAAIKSTTPNGPTGTALLLWNPMAAKAETYNGTFTKHFVSNTNFYADAASGTLPQLSYLIPPGNDSDHPPASSARAQTWISSIVNAVEDSPDWNHTALFITYDEYGGFYDHVAPPIAPGTNQTLGFRVPFLVISPYAKENYISHNVCYFECLLKLVEDRFSLPCLTAYDCNAPSLLDYFHFNQTPRPPIPFANTTSNASYPMPLQNGTNFNSWPSAPYVPARDLVYFPYGEGPDVD
ncbi:MAG TPA: alkaline phosphatase family protein [Thermoplasmata archaeon]|nr:alkaline phosphatase family protein [Thermoplasmata archaeon]